MISEWSYDTEVWSNDARNKQFCKDLNFSQYCFFIYIKFAALDMQKTLYSKQDGTLPLSKK